MEELEAAEAPMDLFAFRISYDTVEENSGSTALFNGNISETFWRAASDNVLRKYSYVYDSMNRLNEAIYQKPGSSNPIPGSYNEIITYDANGNIDYIKRTGGLDSPDMALQIDDLKFTYDDKSNKLRNVIDYENSSQGFDDDSDGTDDTEDDYDYDVMGNLIMDQNKKIESITGSNFTSVWDSDDPETISAGEAIELLDASFGGSGENVSISGPPGRLTLAMAKAWYQYGNGVNYHISLSSLDLSKVRLSDFDNEGIALIALDGRHFSNDEDALIHGTITLELIQGTNEARVRYNSEIDGRGGMFNFDIKSWDNNYLRNIFTYIGEKFYGSRFGTYTTLRYVGGTPFAIHYSGFVTINK